MIYSLLCMIISFSGLVSIKFSYLLHLFVFSFTLISYLFYFVFFYLNLVTTHVNGSLCTDVPPTQAS